MGVLQKSGVGMVKQMLEVIKTQLAKEIPVHYHLSDIEPRLTPLELIKLEQLHKDTLLLLNQFESCLAQAEKERDAAADDARLGTMCDTCKHNNSKDYSNKPCYKCDETFSYWEWRGGCEEKCEGGDS